MSMSRDSGHQFDCTCQECRAQQFEKLRADLDAAREQLAAASRRAIIDAAIDLEKEAHAVPVGATFTSGGLFDTPRFDVIMWAARWLRRRYDVALAAQPAAGTTATESTSRVECYAVMAGESRRALCWNKPEAEAMMPRVLGTRIAHLVEQSAAASAEPAECPTFAGTAPEYAAMTVEGIGPFVGGPGKHSAVCLDSSLMPAAASAERMSEDEMRAMGAMQYGRHYFPKDLPGVSEQTVRSLKRRGLVLLSPDPQGWVCTPTQSGLAAATAEPAKEEK